MNESRFVDCSAFSSAVTTILLTVMMFEALLFAIFTWIMFGTQLHAIITDETGIEQLKREVPSWQRRSKWKSLQVRVCGGDDALRDFNCRL